MKEKLQIIHVILVQNINYTGVLPLHTYIEYSFEL